MVNIMIGSMTYAMKGKNALQRSGIASEIRRAPDFLSQRGCGFSLEIGRGDLNRALNTLSDAGIAPRSVWEQSAGGYKELRRG